MSGPKCLEVVQTTLHAARQGNRAECDRALAQYRRVFLDCQQVLSRLKGCGVEVRSGSPSPESLAQEVHSVFADPTCDGIGAVRRIYARKEVLEKSLSAAEERLRETASDIQRRVRELARNVQAVEKQKRELKDAAQRTVAPDWAREEQERLSREVREVLENAPSVSGVSEVRGAAGIRALQEAEERAASALRDLSRNRKALEQKVSAAEERIREAAADFERRIEELARSAAAVEKGKRELEEQVQKVVPADWPRAERDRLKRRLREVLESAPAIPRISKVSDRAAVRALQKAEELATGALRGLSEGTRSLEEDINRTHCRLVGAQLRERAGPVTLLKDVLRGVSDVSASPGSPPGLAMDKIDRLLGELSVLQDHGAWASIAGRAAAIWTDRDEGQRRLRYDALVIDCSELLNQRRRSIAWQKEVGQMIDSCAHLTGAAIDAIRNELEELRRAGKVVGLAGYQRRLDETRTLEEGRLAREEKRRAVVESLAALGYEATEGAMETALVDAGKVYMRKAGEDEYAVEFVVDHDLSLLQTALVRFADSPDSSSQQRVRDKEKEDAWCSDHARLMGEMRRRGMESHFKLKIPSGQQAVRVVTTEDRRQRRREAMGVKPAIRSKEARA